MNLNNLLILELTLIAKEKVCGVFLQNKTQRAIRG
jgi:hypothetical protein